MRVKCLQTDKQVCKQTGRQVNNASKMKYK